MSIYIARSGAEDPIKATCGVFQTLLHARIPRVQCPERGVRQAKVPWAEPKSRFTLLFEHFAIEVMLQTDGPCDSRMNPKSGGILLQKTPLWYYVLREAMVLHNGDQLGPTGGRIIADTFVRMLKRDGDSYLRVGGFTPFLPSATAGDFTVADLVTFAGVTQP